MDVLNVCGIIIILLFWKKSNTISNISDYTCEKNTTIPEKIPSTIISTIPKILPTTIISTIPSIDQISSIPKTIPLATIIPIIPKIIIKQREEEPNEEEEEEDEYDEMNQTVICSNICGIFVGLGDIKFTSQTFIKFIG